MYSTCHFSYRGTSVCLPRILLLKKKLLFSLHHLSLNEHDLVRKTKRKTLTMAIAYSGPHFWILDLAIFSTAITVIMPEARKKTPFTNHPLKICSCLWKTRLPSRQRHVKWERSNWCLRQEKVSGTYNESLCLTHKGLHKLISSFLPNTTSALVKHLHYLPCSLLPITVVISLPHLLLLKLLASYGIFRDHSFPRH